MEKVRVVVEEVGEGWYVGNVTTFAFGKVNAEGEYQLVSREDAERRPSDEDIARMRGKQWEFIEMPNNPRIELDSGGVVYGCQVWWHPVDEVKEA
jgi:hypothetical protein